MENPVTFKRKEITLIFLMLVLVSTLIFGLGIYAGREYQKITTQDDVKAHKIALGSKMMALTLSLQAAKEKMQQKIIQPKLDSKPFNGYTVQVNVLDDMTLATEELEKFKSEGFPSVFIRKATVDQRLLYFIDLGFFQKKSNANMFAQKLKKRGLLERYFIRKTYFDNDTKDQKN